MATKPNPNYHYLLRNALEKYRTAAIEAAAAPRKSQRPFNTLGHAVAVTNWVTTMQNDTDKLLVRDYLKDVVAVIEDLSVPQP